MSSKVRQREIGPELRTRTKEYLEAKGYEVIEEAKRVGKSKVVHIFDMLAQMDDGFNTYTLAVCIASGGDRVTEVDTVFHFANKAYDCGIIDRVIIAAPALSQQTKELARKQRIKVIDEDLVERLLTSQPVKAAKPRDPIKFETKEELVKSLASRGYIVEEEPRVKGRSGVEYTFDILAHATPVRSGIFWV